MSVPECPPDWQYHPWYRLSRRQMALAAEVPASQAGRRAWVGVSPSQRAPGAYVIQYFELRHADLETVRAGDDVDAYYLNDERVVASGLDAVRLALSRWLDDLDQLVQPVFCGYPA